MTGNGGGNDGQLQLFFPLFPSFLFLPISQCFTFCLLVISSGDGGGGGSVLYFTLASHQALLVTGVRDLAMSRACVCSGRCCCTVVAFILLVLLLLVVVVVADLSVF